MDILDAITLRHSVRSYQDKAIDEATKQKLLQMIEECNRQSGLHIQLVTDEPKAFDGFMAHYGKFSGVHNYLAMVGPKTPDLDEKCGYFGEKLVLFAQQLGLNTCWVALTYSKIKSAFIVESGEKLCLVIAIGYGKNQGFPHPSKPAQEVCKTDGDMPLWFQNGIQAALLAPTAMNQQKFFFTLENGYVTLTPGFGFYTKIDMGIARYHFEIGSGTGNWAWKNALVNDRC